MTKLGQRLFENARKGNEGPKGQNEGPENQNEGPEAKMRAQKAKINAQKAKMKALKEGQNESPEGQNEGPEGQNEGPEDQNEALKEGQNESPEGQNEGPEDQNESLEDQNEGPEDQNEKQILGTAAEGFPPLGLGYCPSLGRSTYVGVLRQVMGSMATAIGNSTMRCWGPRGATLCFPLEPVLVLVGCLQGAGHPDMGGKRPKQARVGI